MLTTNLESTQTREAGRIAGTDLIADLYRTALCVAGDAKSAEALVEAAVDRAVAAGAPDAGPPGLDACLGALARTASAFGRAGQEENAVPFPEDGDLSRQLVALWSLPIELRVPAAIYLTHPVSARRVAAILMIPLETVRARLSLALRYLATYTQVQPA